MFEGLGQLWGDAVEVVVEQLEHEVPRRFLGCPRPVVLLVGAEQDALTLLPGVDLAGKVDEGGQLMSPLLVELDDLGDRFGHQVVVLHREHRQLDAAHPPHLASPQSTRIDDVFGVDGVIPIGDDIPGAVAALAEPGDPGVEVHLRTAVAGTDGVGMGDPVWVDAALVLVVQRAHEEALLEQRVHLLGFPHGHHLHVHAEIAAAGLGHAQPVETHGRVRQLQTTGQVDAAVLAGLCLDLLVQVHRVLLEAGHVRVAVERVHAAGRVPRGAGRELLSLQQNDVSPPCFGEVVENACADDAAADHHDLS